MEDKPHTLVVWAVDDGLEPTVEWRVVHPPTCPWDAYRRYEPQDAPFFDQKPTGKRVFVRACLTQYQLGDVGIEDVVDGWPLAPGRYEVIFESVRYPGEFGGTWGEEWDVEVRVAKQDELDDVRPPR